jgi:hypothetical protein
MKKILLGLILGLGLVTWCPAQTQSVPAAFPSPCSIGLQSDPKLFVGLTDFLAYVLPGTAGIQKFNVVQGLANPKYVSFESVQYPGYFLRHQNYQIKLHPFADNDNLYASDATFIPVANPKVPGGWMFQAYAPYELWLSVTRDNALFAVPNPRYEDSTFVLAP